MVEILMLGMMVVGGIVFIKFLPQIQGMIGGLLPESTTPTGDTGLPTDTTAPTDTGAAAGGGILGGLFPVGAVPVIIDQSPDVIIIRDSDFGDCECKKRGGTICFDIPNWPGASVCYNLNSSSLQKWYYDTDLRHSLCKTIRTRFIKKYPRAPRIKKQKITQPHHTNNDTAGSCRPGTRWNPCVRKCLATSNSVQCPPHDPRDEHGCQSGTHFSNCSCTCVPDGQPEAYCYRPCGKPPTPQPIPHGCPTGQKWNWCVKGCVPSASMMPDCPPPAGSHMAYAYAGYGSAEPDWY
jgi:hypothetical protein